jgi:2-octaprenylphenol hydroxylase
VVTQSFERKLGDVQVVSARHTFPLICRHTLQYTGSRWLLLGDAAHTIHPLAGLGLNLGLADVQAFAHQIQQHQSPPWSIRHLSAYERHRNAKVSEVIHLMNGLNRLFSSTKLPYQFVRGLGLNLLDKLPMIKRLLIEAA